MYGDVADGVGQWLADITGVSAFDDIGWAVNGLVDGFGEYVGDAIASTPEAIVWADENPEVIGAAVLDGAQVVLDVVGFIPGVGELADLANAGISAARGDYAADALSLTSAIPIVGWGAAGAKIGKKIAGAWDSVSHGVRTVYCKLIGPGCFAAGTEIALSSVPTCDEQLSQKLPAHSSSPLSHSYEIATNERLSPLAHSYGRGPGVRALSPHLPKPLNPTRTRCHATSR